MFLFSIVYRMKNHLCLFGPLLWLQKQKVQQESGNDANVSISQPRVIHQFPQKKPVAVDTSGSKPQLSKDILAGVSVKSVT